MGGSDSEIHERPVVKSPGRDEQGIGGLLGQQKRPVTEYIYTQIGGVLFVVNDANSELNQLSHTIAHRLARYLERQGLLERDAEHRVDLILKRSIPELHLIPEYRY